MDSFKDINGNYPEQYRDPHNWTRMVPVTAITRDRGNIPGCRPSPVEKVMLYSGSYAPDHPYLGMHIESLLDHDFIEMNKSSIPACWHPQRGA